MYILTSFYRKDTLNFLENKQLNVFSHYFDGVELDRSDIVDIKVFVDEFGSPQTCEIMTKPQNSGDQPQSHNYRYEENCWVLIK